jgi:hypothetical protein
MARIATSLSIRQTIGHGDENRRLAKRVLAQREAEAQLGLHRLPAARTPTFAEFATGWMDRQRARGLRPKTLESYEDALTHHLLPTFGAVRLGAVTRRDVDAFLVERTQVRRSRLRRKKTDTPPPTVPYAAATINKALIVLKAILSDAVEHGVLSENPAARVKALRAPDRADAVRALSSEDVTRLLKRLNRTGGPCTLLRSQRACAAASCWGSSGPTWTCGKASSTSGAVSAASAKETATWSARRR